MSLCNVGYVSKLQLYVQLTAPSASARFITAKIFPVSGDKDTYRVGVNPSEDMRKFGTGWKGMMREVAFSEEQEARKPKTVGTFTKRRAYFRCSVNASESPRCMWAKHNGWHQRYKAGPGKVETWTLADGMPREFSPFLKAVCRTLYDVNSEAGAVQMMNDTERLLPKLQTTNRDWSLIVPALREGFVKPLSVQKQRDCLKSEYPDVIALSACDDWDRDIYSTVSLAVVGDPTLKDVLRYASAMQMVKDKEKVQKWLEKNSPETTTDDTWWWGLRDICADILSASTVPIAFQSLAEVLSTPIFVLQMDYDPRPEKWNEQVFSPL